MRNSKLLMLCGLVALTAACTKPNSDATKPAAGASATKPAATAAPVAPPVATVNGKAITPEMFDTFLQAATGKPAAEIDAEQKKKALDQLIDMTLVAQQADKDGYGKDAKVQAQIELIRTQALAQAASEKIGGAQPVTDADLKAEYDAQIASMPKEFKARHVLVEKKEDAEAIIRELKAGADFGKMAKAKSKDPGSAKAGGELGWFSAGAMVKPFSDALAGMQKGQLTEQPVQTQFGWHVIQLEDVRSPTPPALDQVKPQVEMLVKRKRLQTYVEGLRKSAKIERTG